MIELRDYHGRSWPFGTVKQVQFLSHELARHNGKPCSLSVVMEPATKEAYLLVNGPDEPSYPEGTPGTITFLNGGPLGGYWKFEPSKDATV